jgi:Fe2+ transport system protein FeoA
MSTSLAEIPLGRTATIKNVEGPRAFRRRLLEMGLVPGIEVRVVAIAPLGDPLQIEVRGGQWSIRRNEAKQIEVETAAAAAKTQTGSSAAKTGSGSSETKPGSGSAATRIAATTDRR